MRSLTVSDLVGARLAQQAAAAGGELSLSVDDAPREQISANSGLIASFSSRGPAPYSLALKPDVAAPGVDIVSPIPGGYGTWSGTSMASPPSPARPRCCASATRPGRPRRSSRRSC